MPKFIFAYQGGTAPRSPEKGKKVMGQWMAWYQGMGAALLDGGGPVGPSTTVSPGGVSGNGGANPISGYTLVEAANMDAAAKMAKGCPMVVDGSGSVEIAEIMQM